MEILLIGSALTRMDSVCTALPNSSVTFIKNFSFFLMKSSFKLLNDLLMELEYPVKAWLGIEKDAAPDLPRASFVLKAYTAVIPRHFRCFESG